MKLVLLGIAILTIGITQYFGFKQVFAVVAMTMLSFLGFSLPIALFLYKGWVK